MAFESWKLFSWLNHNIIVVYQNNKQTRWPVCRERTKGHGVYTVLTPIRTKTTLFLCLIKYTPGQEDVWGSGGRAPLFLTGALKITTFSGCFTPFGILGTHWITDWVESRVGLDSMEKWEVTITGIELRTLGHPASSHTLHQLRYTNFLGSHTETNSVVLSPQANYTDWATATCRRNLVLTFVDKGMSRGQRGGSSTVINHSFLDRSR
jgi:hypothetical protein